jgi:hypothetical protein
MGLPIKMNMLNKTMVAALAMSTVMGTAAAGTVDFEDVTLANSSYTYFNGSNKTFSSGGFDFTFQSDIAAFLTRTQICSPSCPVNGSTFVLAPFGKALTMARTDRATFTLQAFDGAGAFNFNEWGSPGYIPSQIHVSGFTADGTEFVKSFAIDKSAASGPLAFTSYALDELFTDLVSVSFYSSGSTGSSTYNGFAIDNIVVADKAADIPEPSTVALLGLGLVGYAAARRRPPQ